MDQPKPAQALQQQNAKEKPQDGKLGFGHSHELLSGRGIILPTDKLQLLPWIYGNAIVDEREDLEDGSVRLDLRLTESQALEEIRRRTQQDRERFMATTRI